MNALPNKPTLKEINSYKKKLSWSDVPTIYHLASTSIGDLDSILSHGFDSGYKQIFDPNNLNLEYLKGHIDLTGNIHLKRKPKISLRHIYNEQHYELHCYPIVQGERINKSLHEHPYCSFKHWRPETMKVMFRLSNLVSFIVYAFENGDDADMALIKYAHKRVEQIIATLMESFEVIDVIGFNIANFYKAISQKKSALEINQLLEDPNQQMET